MKTRILILITTIVVVMFSVITATAQEKAMYFMKDDNAIYSSTITDIDSIILVPKPKLFVSPSTLSFSAAAATSRNVAVNTNQPLWNVTSDQTWCTVTKGTNQFTVTATANAIAEQRTATITISAGYAPNVTVAVTQASAEPDIAFVARNPVVEYLYTTTGFFNGSRINFDLIVYDAAERTSITIQEVASFGALNADPKEIRQTRVIPISGPGTYSLSQEMLNTGEYGYGDTSSQFTYTVSAHGKSYSRTYSGICYSSRGRWDHYFRYSR